MTNEKPEPEADKEHEARSVDRLIFFSDAVTAHAFQWGFYALLQVLISAALFTMVRHMISHDLVEPGTEDKDGKASDWRTTVRWPWNRNRGG